MFKNKLFVQSRLLLTSFSFPWVFLILPDSVAKYMLSEIIQLYINILPFTNPFQEYIIVNVTFGCILP